MTLYQKRWIVLAAGVLANAGCGAGYAFSVFKKPLIAILHCTDPQVTLTFSLQTLFLPLGMLVSGAIARRRDPRLVICCGGVIFGLGVLLSGFSGSLGWLYATFGVMASVGQGASYGTIIAVAVSWFPDRRGMASGLVVGALGVATLIIAPVAQFMIAHIGVMRTLNALGLATIIVIVITSRLIVSPPKDFGAKSAQSADRTANEVGWQQMLAKPMFWALFAMYLLGAFSGLMVISQASDVAQTMAALTPAAAAVAVGLLGLSNSAGRLLWGGMSDRIGRLCSIGCMLAVTAALMLLMPKLAQTQAGLIGGYILLGLCYGGYLGTFPSLCADAFGGRNLGVNYSLLFIAFAIAGVLGPRTGAVLRAVTGNYVAGFHTAALIAATGLVVTIGLSIRLAHRG